MSDFETHPVGTRFEMELYRREIELSRALARAIEIEIKSYGMVVPHAVYHRYQALKELYAQQIEKGLM